MNVKVYASPIVLTYDYNRFMAVVYPGGTITFKQKEQNGGWRERYTICDLPLHAEVDNERCAHWIDFNRLNKLSVFFFDRYVYPPRFSIISFINFLFDNTDYLQIHEYINEVAVVYQKGDGKKITVNFKKTRAEYVAYLTGGRRVSFNFHDFSIRGIKKLKRILDREIARVESF
ncbi:MAG: hypothetical protein ABIK73_06945 [candidate division WOR-3 bacterium]